MRKCFQNKNQYLAFSDKIIFVALYFVFSKMDAKCGKQHLLEASVWLAQLNPVGAFLSYDPLEEESKLKQRGVVVFNQASSKQYFSVAGKGLNYGREGSASFSMRAREQRNILQLEEEN